MEGQAIQVAGGVPGVLPAPWASLRGRLGRLWTLLVGQIVDDDILGAGEPAAAGRVVAPPSREIDGAVLRRAQRGDHGAFHEIVDHYEGRLRVLAYHLLRDADLMNDALQDTFVKAWGGLPEFRGEAALGTWLHQVCYRICLDYLRRQKVRPAGEQLADDLADPTDDVGGLALRDQVSAALGRLPVEQRAVLLLVDREGYDYGTVAEALEVPVGTVASRLSLARAAMRRALRPETPVRRCSHDRAPRRPARPAALRAPAGERGRAAAEAGLPRRARGPAPEPRRRPRSRPSRRAAGASGPSACSPPRPSPRRRRSSPSPSSRRCAAATPPPPATSSPP